MSSTKKYWFAVQEEQKEALIRDHLADEDSDKYSDEWAQGVSLRMVKLFLI